MHRLLLTLIVFGFAAVGQGCRSCHSPYDYSSPVADGECAGCDTYGGRAGSVLSTSYAALQPEYYDESMLDQEPQLMESIAE